MKFLSFFKKPYPYEDSVKKRLFICLAFGVFIGLFLFFFQPFGISETTHKHKELFVLGYGLVTFISLLFTMFFIPFLFKGYYFSEKWTTGREILHISITISIITVLNILYSHLLCIRLLHIGNINLRVN